MAIISRTSLIVGPALITRGLTSMCYTRDNIDVRIDKTQVPVRTDGGGVVDYRDDDVMVKMTFTPAEYTAVSRELLYPYLGPTPGYAIFGATDTICCIQDTNSHKHTIVASAVTKMPSLRLSVKDPMFGPCEITGIRKLGADWATADSLYKQEDSGGDYTLNQTFSPAAVKQQQYTGVLTGVTGYTVIDTEDGWTVDFDTEIAYQRSEQNGTVRASLLSVSAMAKCTPLAVSSTNLLTALKVQATAGNLRGQSVNASGSDLVITGRAASGAPVITLHKTMIKGAGYRFGSSVLRDGEVGFVATAEYTLGQAGPLFTLA